MSLEFNTRPHAPCAASTLPCIPRRPLMRALVAAALAGATALAAAAPRLAAIFGDGMVLQRHQPVVVWGWAEPGEAVQVQFRGHSRHARADATGRFQLRLPAGPAGGPFEMTLQGQGMQQLRDLWVGDVWVASGQSNMEWSLAQAQDGAREVAAAEHPLIRHRTLPHRASLRPEADVAAGTWHAASPATAGRFTAVGYFFARAVQAQLPTVGGRAVPIGIVHSSWGGTHAETWMSREAALAEPDLAPAVQRLPATLDDWKAFQLSQQRAAAERWQGPARAGDDDAAGWPAAEHDDSAWRSLQVPQPWEEQGLPGFDGVVWFRRTIELSGTQAAAGATLHLGTIDDCDEVWLNGQRLGGVCQWDRLRRYPVPAGLLHEGRNVLVVKVTDTGGGGGFYGDAAVVRLDTAAGAVPLAGAWRARIQPQVVSQQPQANDAPTLAYNGMLHPLLPLRVRGVIWYQGESNVPRAERYAHTFQTLIRDWRRQLGQPALPFYFVQLASFLPLAKNDLNASAWAELREAQRQTLALPHTGMVVTTDVGDANDIHPRDKKTVGERLAAVALRDTYRQPVHASGPRLLSGAAQGEHFVLRFDAPAGLAARGGDPLRGFALAGADRRFVRAQAHIEGHRVVLRADGVPQPVAARYGWVDNPEESNLVDGRGWPASPLRTDAWPQVTEGRRF